MIDFLVLNVVLPGGADKYLPGDARLHIKGYAVCSTGVSTLQISQFHQLVPHKSGITVSEREMPLALPDFAS